MWVAIAAVAGFIATVMLKFVDVLIEGRGSWARRAIRADIELLEALPEEIRTDVGGDALKNRINDGLVLFGRSDEAEAPASNDDDEIERRRKFTREVDLLQVRIGAWISAGIVIVIVAWVLMGVLDGEAPEKDDAPDDDEPGFLLTVAAITTVGLAGGVVLSVFTIGTAHAIAVWLVRRRWKRAGLQLPAKRR